MVRRKILVLDLDETLIHSHHDGVIRQTVKPGTPPDFVVKVTIDRHPVRFFVHKRPHVDFFLDVVSRLSLLFTTPKTFFITNSCLHNKYSQLLNQQQDETNQPQLPTPIIHTP